MDPGLLAATRDAVVDLLDRFGITAVLVTHDQAEALSFADQVAVMRAGRFLEMGTSRDLYQSPRTRMVAEFLGARLSCQRIWGRGWPAASWAACQ